MPLFRPKRPVPYAALSALEKELDRLEENGFISEVNYSTWAAPIVVVKKENKFLRIFADLSTGLNEALELHQHPFPFPEDIFATLSGGQYFTDRLNRRLSPGRSRRHFKRASRYFPADHEHNTV
ncbi:hypothetical protein AB6A40_010226 [Gnathostoma spinigerum]|uniref:Uncharacterized protein n=1 Tax=Gnathostoma spinigerum TaxID=75299 RepID=A0ABD6EWM3_9BILA